MSGFDKTGFGAPGPNTVATRGPRNPIGPIDDDICAEPFCDEVVTIGDYCLEHSRTSARPSQFGYSGGSIVQDTIVVCTACEEYHGGYVDGWHNCPKCGAELLEVEEG